MTGDKGEGLRPGRGCATTRSREGGCEATRQHPSFRDLFLPTSFPGEWCGTGTLLLQVARGPDGLVR